MKLERANNTVSQSAGGATFAAFGGGPGGGDDRGERYSAPVKAKNDIVSGGGEGTSKRSGVTSPSSTVTMGAPSVSVRSPVSAGGKGGKKLDESGDDFADADVGDLLND